VKASKLLIPLSYIAIFGGTITLIGTSTNLLVDGVAQRRGMEPFGIFEISGVGLALAAVGVALPRLRRPLPAARPRVDGRPPADAPR
jgi:di/tricarboxylate transporter